jgi:hypothetical protein
VKGDVQEAFRVQGSIGNHVAPLPQTMVQQTEEQVDLHQRRDPPRDPFLINLQATMIPDKVPLDHKIRDAARELTNGQTGKASKMHAKYIKLWLCGITLEEDPKKGLDNVGKGDN